MTNSTAFISRDGVYYLVGAIDFNTSPALLLSSEALFSAHPNQVLTLNFTEIASTTNSAALAMIIEWLKLAARYHITLKFVALPEAVLSIAKVSGMIDLIQECL